MDGEQFSIIMVFKEFHSMLLVRNSSYDLTFSLLNRHCMLPWWLFVRRYGPTILYHPHMKISVLIFSLAFYGTNGINARWGEYTCCPLWFYQEWQDVSNDHYHLKCFLCLSLSDVKSNNPFDFIQIYEQQNIGNKPAKSNQIF